MEIYFVHPEYLLFLLAIPVIILIHFVSIKLTKRVAIKFSNFEALSKIRGIDFYSKNLIILFLTILTLTLLICSLANLTIKIQKQASDFSFAIAIDSSQSMGATDLMPNRLEAAKDTALNFVSTLPEGTRITIISFSGSAIVEQPITIDKTLINNAIRNINITSIGGTDISETLVTSVNQIYGENNKAVIIMSDGQLNTGSVDEAIRYARVNNVIIHTIGIGTDNGGTTFYGLSKLDSEALKSLAYNTKGTYAEATNSQQLKDSFRTISDFKLMDVPIDLSKYFLMISILLFVLIFVLLSTKYRTYP